MKKINIIMLIGILAFGIAGCTQVKEGMEQVLGETMESATVDSEELYRSLSSIVSAPEHIDTFHSEYVGKEVEFALYVFGEPEEYTFEDEDASDINGHKFAPASLARNNDAYFLLNVEEITQLQVEAGKYYKVKASLEGTMYSTEGGEREDIVYFDVKSMEEYIPTNREVSESTFSLSNGDVTFFDYEIIQDIYGGDVFVLYFEFENRAENEQAPIFSEIIVDHADMFLSSEGLLLTDAELKRTNALSSSGYVNDDPTPPGKALPYYISYELEDATQPICFTMYDDEFNMLNTFLINPSESSEGLTSAE
jgi:hypothetical protein